MIYFIAITMSIGVCVGFLALTRFEMRRGGVRYMATRRHMLDVEVDRWKSAVEHIDVPVMVNGAVRTLSARLAHDVAHGTLVAVRFIERMLTRAVRALRMHHATTVISTTAHPSSDFVATMKDFKEELRNGRKTVDVVDGGILNKE